MASQIITLETGWQLAVYQSVTSTSDVLFSDPDLTEGRAVLARQQTKGRGRQGRIWSSQLNDGMYLSLALRPQRQMQEWPTLSFVAALALIRALGTKFPQLPCGLKWPNDVLVNGQKISGLLLEAKQPFVVIGCGVNLKNAPKIEDASFAPTDLLALTGTAPKPEQMATSFLNAFYSLYQQWQISGFSAIYDLYKSHLLFLSEQVGVRQGNQIISGMMQGISEEGSLLLEKEDGQTISLSTGDVNLIRFFDATSD